MQIQDYLAVLRKSWRLILLTAVVTTLSAVVFAKLQQPIYRSSAVLEVTGRLDYGATLAINQLLRQTANRLQTLNMAGEVDRRYQFDLGAERLLEKIHTQAFPDTVTIQIDVDDTDPARARQIARGFAEVFVERETASQEGLPQQERRIVNMLDEPKPPRLYWPQTRVFLLSGLILGLVLGVLLAFARDFLDDSLKTPEDVERYLGGITTLGTIPHWVGVAPAGPSPSAGKPAARPPAPAGGRTAAGGQRGVPPGG